MSLMFPMARPISRKLSSIRKIERWVTDLKAAGGMFYTIPSISLTDFEIEIEFATTQTGNRLLLCDDHITSYYINSYSDVVSFWSQGIEYATRVVGKTVNDGKLHVVTYKLTGTQLQVFFDGVLYGNHTFNRYLGVVNFKAGNRTVSANTFEGSFFSTKIWSGGDRNTGELARDYRFNDNDGILVDYSGNNANGASVNVTAADRELMTWYAARNAWVGVERWYTKAWLSTSVTNWTLSTDSATSAGVNSTSYAYKEAMISVGDVALVTYSINISSGSCFLSLSNGGATKTHNTSGAFETVGQKTENASVYFGANPNSAFTVSNVSLKRIIEVAS